MATCTWKFAPEMHVFNERFECTFTLELLEFLVSGGEVFL